MELDQQRSGKEYTIYFQCWKFKRNAQEDQWSGYTKDVYLDWHDTD